MALEGVVLTCCVDIVRRVVTPRETRAGTAFGSSQKLTCGKDGENGDLEEYAEWLEMSRWYRCVMMETKKGNKTEI